MNTYKFKFLSFTIACVILIATTSSQCKTSPNVKILPLATDGFAVMELFTSQGCSSCPPADNLLGKYAAQNNDKLIALAFHVDYWNQLGWTDSFSSEKYSNRQRDYSTTINNSSVYTPQLVINGTKEFVGSDETKIVSEIENVLKQKPALSISINKTERTGNKLSINYSLDKTYNNTTLQAALVQKQVFTNILKGENRGLKLTNYNVVRDFVSTAAKNKTAFIDLQIPAGYNEKDFSIVLYVQEDVSGKIIGATKKIL
ncbi:MAG: DUF1223 domain-containing protein [Ferruginibacter sp.]